MLPIYIANRLASRDCMEHLDFCFRLCQVQLFEGKKFENRASHFVKQLNKQYHMHR